MAAPLEIHEGGYPAGLFLQPVDSNFNCAICLDVAREPMLCDHDHLFCAGCIGRWLENNRTCPIDRATLLKGMLSSNRVVANVISGLNVRCLTCCSASPPPFPVSAMTERTLLSSFSSLSSNTGTKRMLTASAEGALPAPPCAWTGKLSELQSHVRAHVAVRCTLDGCSAIVQSGDLTAHMNACAHRLEACAYGCGKAVKVRDTLAHRSSCPRKPTPCPNAGCVMTLLRDELQAHRDEQCMFEEVACPFAASVGCQYRCIRRDMAAHSADMPFHFAGMMETIARQQTKVQVLETTAQEQQTKMQVLETNAQQQHAKVQGLEMTAQQQQTKAQQQQTKVQVLETTAQQQQTKVQQQHAKVQGLEMTVQQMQRKVQGLETTVQQQHAKMCGLETAVQQQQQAKMQQLETKVLQQQAMVQHQQTKAQQQQQQMKIQGQETAVQGLKTTLQQQLAKVQQLETKMQNQQGKVYGLEMAVQQKQAKIQALETKIQILEKKPAAFKWVHGTYTWEVKGCTVPSRIFTPVFDVGGFDFKLLLDSAQPDEGRQNFTGLFLHMTKGWKVRVKFEFQIFNANDSSVSRSESGEWTYEERLTGAGFPKVLTNEAMKTYLKDGKVMVLSTVSVELPDDLASTKILTDQP